MVKTVKDVENWKRLLLPSGGCITRNDYAILSQKGKNKVDALPVLAVQGVTVTIAPATMQGREVRA